MNSKHILLVEDNPRDQKLTLAALELHNISAKHVTIAQDGVEALDYLFGKGVHAARENLGEMPDLILLDLKMPKLDGIETLKRLRADARTAMIPVIILTTSRQEEDINASYRLGINSYIRKPVDFQEFKVLIGKLLEYWLTMNEPPQYARGS